MAWTPVRHVFLESREYYDKTEDAVVTARSLLKDLHRTFRARVLEPFDAADAKRENTECSSESSDDDSDAKEEKPNVTTRKWDQQNPQKRSVSPKNDPKILNSDLFSNEQNRLNDGKACRCKKVLRGYGTKHGHLVGDDQQKFTCEPRSNNAKTLFCYRIHLDPTVNFDSSSPTTIFHNGKQFAFQGFCLLSHQKLDQYPMAQTTRFNVSYTATLESIPVPLNFVVEDLNLFKGFVFTDILELRDWRLKAESLESDKKICDVLHFLPIFGRTTDGVLEVAPMSSVLDHILHDFCLMFSEDDAQWLKTTSQSRFEEEVQSFRGALVAQPGRKPAALRVDQIDRDTRDVAIKDKRDKDYPALVHFTTRCSNTFDQNFAKAQRKLDSLRTAMESKPREHVSPEEKMRCHDQQKVVDEMRARLNVKREVTVVLSCREFYHSGLRSDVAQYGLLIPWIALHFRFHVSLDVLEEKLGYAFRDRNLLELALTHPSYRCNLGTNPDHIRNSQANLGLRKTAYGQGGTIPKSGMKTLIHTMAQLGAEEEMASPIKNYERLEFLGDAVLEFLTSVRLFLIFPEFQEGSLATFRATLVQNNHLAMLAEAYSLTHFLLLSHGREVSSRKRITDRHAAANCFEAICGAIYLDNGIKFVDEFISKSLGARLFGHDEHLYNVWRFPPAHLSESQYPEGDRHLIEKHEHLQRVVGFEVATGIQFNHIRLLANAFSSRQVHDNPITIGNNQRLEFLGDTVLQLIVSDHLFKHFPTHHEGHLSLLRSSLVSNETQAEVCDELGMRRFLIREQNVTKDGHGPDIKMKDKADLVEAFLGALYLDQGLIVSEAFCEVVFFPKLTDFIGNQSWSDPKSRLQQCCLTLRSAERGPPKLPEYRMINKEGPSNNRKYQVAVFYNGERLATGAGSNTKQAEKAAAEAALKNPIFLTDFQRQQDFAKRAVAAQKHQSRLNHQRKNGYPGREPSPSSNQIHRKEEPLTRSRNSDRRDDSQSRKANAYEYADRRTSLSHPGSSRSNSAQRNSISGQKNGRDTSRPSHDSDLGRQSGSRIESVPRGSNNGPERRDPPRTQRPSHNTNYDRCLNGKEDPRPPDDGRKDHLPRSTSPRLPNGRKDLLQRSSVGDRH